VDWLNYHHLRYVWAVARQGSIGRAAKSLRVAPPTVSAQIHQLEETLGHTLFVRRGRNLVPTEMGEVAARFGDQIFSLGQALVDELSNRASRPQRLVVGVSDVLARSIVHRILEPAFRPDMNLRVVCRESRSPLEFDTELARHTMDVVLSNAPATRGGPVRMYSHPLGECGHDPRMRPRRAGVAVEVVHARRGCLEPAQQRGSCVVEEGARGDPSHAAREPARSAVARANSSSLRCRWP